MLGSTARETQQDLTSVWTSQTFTFTAPVGFVTPNDSRTCYSPWSVFQDGSGGTSTTTPQTIGPGNSATHATDHRTDPSHHQACLNKQHSNQTRTRQQPGTHAHTTSRRLRHTAQNHRSQLITPEDRCLQQATDKPTSYLPSRPSKDTRPMQVRFNRNSQTAVPVVVTTLRKCTGKLARRTPGAHNT